MDPPSARVLPSGELPAPAEGARPVHRVEMAGTDVLVTRLSTGEPVAFAATCPHQRTDLEGATLADGRIRCPLHGYVYDARTGENVDPAPKADPATLWKLKPGYLPVYPVEERDGWIWIGTHPRPPPSSYDPDLERAPVAPVSADGAAGSTETLRVAPGTTFELRLATTPRPGFVWRFDTGGPLLSVVEERLQPGDPPHHLVRVAVRGQGRATLRCLYARPWDAKPAEVRTYDVRVEPT